MTLRERIASAAVEDLPAIAAELAEAQTALALRVATVRPEVKYEVGGAPDRNADIHEAARLTGMSESWLKKNSKNLPFTVKTTGKRRLFSVQGIERWNLLNRRRTQAARG